MLTGTADPVQIGDLHGRWPHFSPDGRSLLFQMTDGAGSSLFVANGDGSGARRVSAQGIDAFSPGWAPDGRRITFAATQDNNTDIYMTDADGQHVVRLTTEPGIDGSPVWSPDGQRIAFHSDRSGRIELYVMDLDGSNVTALTPGLVAAGPAWSPDGKQIAFVSGFEKQGGHIALMCANGSSIRTVTKDAEFVGRPAWSPDGTHIVYPSQPAQDRSWSLYLIDLDGGHRTKIADGAVDTFWKLGP